jgi:hypothetical protein
LLRTICVRETASVWIAIATRILSVSADNSVNKALSAAVERCSESSSKSPNAPESPLSAAESGLSGALGLLLEDSEHLSTAADNALLTELSALTDKIRVAIAIHTDAVTRTQMVRGKIIVKLFRLAGTAPLPVTYEFESDVL